jgi:hypothetical protein
MKIFRKIVFGIALVFLFLWMISPIVRAVLNLEFASDSFKMDYKQFLFYAVPIAVILTLCGTLRKLDKIVILLVKIFGTLAIAVIFIGLIAISVFGDMCIYTEKEVLFESKTKPDTKIVVREFGCGATDSQGPSESVFEIQYCNDYFIRTRKIDTTKIDRNEWIKVE